MWNVRSPQMIYLKRWWYKELHIEGFMVWHSRSRQFISTAIKPVDYIISYTKEFYFYISTILPYLYKN